MATLVGLEASLVDTLNHLIELDCDAIEAYRAAIARLREPHDKQTLGSFLQDHQRHVRELSQQVRSLGRKPADHADFKRMLTKGKVVLAALIGDGPILLAMRSNEKDTNTAYERAVSRADAHGDVRITLRLALLDERRHAAWLERRLRLDGAEAHV